MTFLIYDESDGTYCKGDGDWTPIEAAKRYPTREAAQADIEAHDEDELFRLVWRIVEVAA